MVMYHPNNGQRKLQTPNKACMQIDLYCLAVHQNTCESYLCVRRELRHRPPKVGFGHLSNTNLLTSIAYKLKQLLSYFTHRTTSLSSYVVALSARLLAKWQEWWSWLAVVPQSCNTMPVSDVYLLCTCSSRANAFTTLCL